MSGKRYRGLPSSLPLKDPASADEPAASRSSGRFRVPRSPIPPPNYRSRSVERRLLSLVGMLGLILILMHLASQPHRWDWFWQMGGARRPAKATEAIAPAAAGSADEHLARPSKLGWPEGLEPDLLRDVRDNSHFRQAEQTAWFTLWVLLRDASREELRQQSLGPVTYVQLFRQTEAYRGRLVDLTGTIRRVQHVTAPANDLGITDYAQCWLFPDTTPFDPIVLYVLDPPDELNDAVDLALPAQVTGIVYKRWSYMAAEQMEVAPVVLAKDVTLLTPPPTDQPSTLTANRPRFLLAMLGAVVASLLTVTVLLRYSSDRFRASDRTTKLPATLPDLSAMHEAPAADSAAFDVGETTTGHPARADEQLS